MGEILLGLFILNYYIFYRAMDAYRDRHQLSERKWMTLGISLAATSVIFLITIAVSRAFQMEDLFSALIIFTILCGIMSFKMARNKEKVHKRKPFKKVNKFLIVAGIISFILFGVTSTGDDDTVSAGNQENETETEHDDLHKEEKEISEKEEALKKKEEALKKKEEELEKKEKEAEKEQDQTEQKDKEKSEVDDSDQNEVEEETVNNESDAITENETSKSIEINDSLTPVTLYNVIDGDTVHVIGPSGETLKLRLLLIDTPELRGSEPYAQEAKERMIELVNSGEQLYIEYDNGNQQDHYGRELVYLYIDDVNVQKVMLEEGFARVGYVYEQQRYLDEFRAKEQIAKDAQIGVWSIPGYVNVGGEGFNAEEIQEPAVQEPVSEPQMEQSNETTEYYPNCKELKKVYPNGVDRGHPAYHPDRDGDNDGHACE